MYSEGSSSLYNDTNTESMSGKGTESTSSKYSSEASSSKRRIRQLDPPSDLYPLDNVWSPMPGFPGLFVSVDEKGNCVVSGPREYLNIARQQIHDIVLQNLNIEVTNDIRTIEFQGQP